MWLFKIIQKSISLYNATLENMLMWRHFKSDNKSERLRGESVKAGICIGIFHKITKNDCFFIQLVDKNFKSDGLLHLSFEKFSLNIHIKYIYG